VCLVQPFAEGLFFRDTTPNTMDLEMKNAVLRIQGNIGIMVQELQIIKMQMVIMVNAIQHLIRFWTMSSKH